MKRNNKCEVLIKNTCKKRNKIWLCDERLIKKKISGQCQKNALREYKRSISVNVKNPSIFKLM